MRLVTPEESEIPITTQQETFADGMQRLVDAVARRFPGCSGNALNAGVKDCEERQWGGFSIRVGGARGEGGVHASDALPGPGLWMLASQRSAGPARLERSRDGVPNGPQNDHFGRSCPPAPTVYIWQRPSTVCIACAFDLLGTPSAGTSQPARLPGCGSESLHRRDAGRRRLRRCNRPYNEHQHGHSNASPNRIGIPHRTWPSNTLDLLVGSCHDRLRDLRIRSGSTHRRPQGGANPRRPPDRRPALRRGRRVLARRRRFHGRRSSSASRVHSGVHAPVRRRSRSGTRARGHYSDAELQRVLR